MSEAIVIYGGGEHGRVVYEAVVAQGLKVAGVVDAVQPTTFPVQYLGDWSEVYPKYKDHLWHVAIGDNQARDRILKEIADQLTKSLVTVIHPQAMMSATATIGAGCFVAAGAVIATGARLAPGCIINHAASIDHDCVLERCVHVAPGVHLAGCVRVGERTLVGVGSCARPRVQIGCDVTIGAGSVVVKDIRDGVIAFGVPAQIKN